MQQRQNLQDKLFYHWWVVSLFLLIADIFSTQLIFNITGMSSVKKKKSFSKST